MNYLDQSIDLGSETGSDTKPSKESLTLQLAQVQERLAATPETEVVRRERLKVDASRIMIDLEQSEQAWHTARAAFEVLVENKAWLEAVEACDAMFRTEQEDGALCALGHGIWLAVTFPIDPELTVAMLQHVVEETPPESDGAAVAAATAAYVVEMRSEGKQHENLSFYTAQLLGSVARRHSGSHDNVAFAAWMEKLELNDPAKFLVRLRNVVDVLVQEDWWVDRDAIHAELPDQ